MSEAEPAPAATPKLKLLFKVLLLIGFLLVLNYGGSLVVEQINFQLWPEHEHLIITATGSSHGNDVRTGNLPLRLFLVIALKKYYVINQGDNGIDH